MTDDERKTSDSSNVALAMQVKREVPKVDHPDPEACPKGCCVCCGCFKTSPKDSDLENSWYGTMLSAAGILTTKADYCADLWKPALLMIAYYGCWLAGPFAVGSSKWNDTGLHLALVFVMLAFVGVAFGFAWFLQKDVHPKPGKPKPKGPFHGFRALLNYPGG